jgi:polyisoprenyl-phosphate glycosyltransferase
MQTLHLVVPIFNDWDSLDILLRKLDMVAAELPCRLSVQVIDDGSTVPLGADLCNPASFNNLHSIEIAHLFTNFGHQQAIAIGICIAVEEKDCDAILVMDGDGEDPPLAIGRMLMEAGDNANFCVVARRGKRTENLSFKLAYLLYKALFRLLTGRHIAFGNFCLISRSYARRLVCVADLWNSLPAAILRSRLPMKEVRVDRANRYAGISKMNLTSLVFHGLSGISDYAETIFLRFLVLTFTLFVVSGSSIALVLTLRIFYPQYTTPGWATTVSFGVSIILIQTLSITLSMILMLLHGHVQKLIIPRTDYKYYVDERQVILVPRNK